MCFAFIFFLHSKPRTNPLASLNTQVWKRVQPGLRRNVKFVSHLSSFIESTRKHFNGTNQLHRYSFKTRSFTSLQVSRIWNRNYYGLPTFYGVLSLFFYFLLATSILTCLKLVRRKCKDFPVSTKVGLLL